MPAAGDDANADDWYEELNDHEDRISDLEDTVTPLVPIVYDVPRGEIANAEVTSNAILASDTSGEVELWGVATNVLPNRKIRVSATGRYQVAENCILVLRLRSDGTAGSLGSNAEIAGVSVVANRDGDIGGFHITRTLSGDATGLAEGAQTFRLTAQILSGTGIGGVRGSANAPTVLTVDDMGTSV